MTGPDRVILDLPEEAEVVPRAAVPRGVGLALLLVVLVAVAAVAGSRPRLFAGEGTAAPSTALPAVGTCLRWDVDPAAPLTPAAGSIQAVGCRQTHQGQVLSAWRPGDLDDSEQRSRCPPARSLRESGHSSSVAASGDWAEPAAALTSIVVTGGPTRIDVQACVAVLRWDSGSYSLLGINRSVDTAQDARDGGVPADATVSWCLDDQRRSTGCHQPHTFERVGVFSTDGPRDTPATTCQQRARTVIGDDALVAGLAGPSVLSTSVGTTTEETLGGSADVTFQLCDVVAPQGRQLVDTVVGWGARSLPLR